MLREGYIVQKSSKHLEKKYIVTGHGEKKKIHRSPLIDYAYA